MISISTSGRSQSGDPAGPAQPDEAQARVEAPMVYVSETPKWEYKVLIKELAQGEAFTERELNGLGQEGWELAGVAGVSDSVHYYFKRLCM